MFWINRSWSRGTVRLASADPAKAPRTPLDLNGVLRETEEFVQSRREFGHIRFVLDLAEEVKSKLVGKVYSAETLALLESYLAEYRKAGKEAQ